MKIGITREIHVNRGMVVTVVGVVVTVGVGVVVGVVGVVVVGVVTMGLNMIDRVGLNIVTRFDGIRCCGILFVHHCFGVTFSKMIA